MQTCSNYLFGDIIAQGILKNNFQVVHLNTLYHAPDSTETMDTKIGKTEFTEKRQVFSHHLRERTEGEKINVRIKKLKS